MTSYASKVWVCLVVMGDGTVGVRFLDSRTAKFLSDFTTWTRYGMTLFGPKNVFQNKKTDEREFGQNALERYTGSRVLNKKKNTDSNQWTTRFGELGSKVLLELFSGQSLVNQATFGDRRPDLYDPTEDVLYEVKAQSFSVPGTAGDKVYAVPFKYKKLGKKMVTILVGSLEEKYKHLIQPETEDDIHTVNMLRDMCNTRFYGANQLLAKIC